MWTTDTFSDECGWALTVLGTPCVAHLTWPIPTTPSKFLSETFFSNLSTLPSVLTSLIKPLDKVAIPALGLPLYLMVLLMKLKLKVELIS